MASPRRDAWRRVRGVFETAAARLGLALVPRLSRGRVLRLARGLGSAAFLLDRRMRRVGEANLALALGATHTTAQRRAILRGAYQDLALVFLDLLWFARETAPRVAAHAGMTPALRAALDGGPRIIVTGHLGNWEILGHLFCLDGRRITTVAAPLANPALDRLLHRTRTRPGLEILARSVVVLRLLRRLRAGRTFALLLDQNTTPEEGGVFVDFFGLPVPVSQAPALLAMRTGCPVVVCHALPDGNGGYLARHTAVLDPAAWGNGRDPAAVAALTAEIARQLEADVRRWPANWTWVYTRWKYVPPGRARDGYPFYSKRYRPPARAAGP